jgi:arabinogalactan endo-1,4-beta-galactosidase
MDNEIMMTARIIAGVAVIVAALAGPAWSAAELPPAVPSTTPSSAPCIGIDCNYALDMAKRNKAWTAPSGPVDPFALFAKLGCQGARIRLWVGDDGVNQLTYATATASRAQRAGLKPYLVIFLSEEWADFVKQPAPAAWKKMSSEKKLAAVEAYTESVVRHMARNGIDIDTFEIGNEIDFGICGEFEEEWPHRVSVEFMRQRVWPRMAPILKAAEAGVLKAQPKAKFILHLSQWNNVDYCVAFWQAMLTAGVQIDYPGISYFPSSAPKAEERPLKYLSAQAGKIVAALHKPVLICECGYPAAAKFGGQFAAWNHPADGYPLSDAGQARWIADFVAVVRSDPSFAGAFYWSPEWYDGGLWDAFAMFDAHGVARPGVWSFRANANDNSFVAADLHLCPFVTSMPDHDTIKPDESKETVLTGTFVWKGSKPPKPTALKAVLTASGTSEWTAVYSFSWGGNKTWTGTVKGDLKNGKVSGDTSGEGGRTFVFDGTAKDGVLTFDCAETTKGAHTHQATGTLKPSGG